jgi:hypothetical protein
MQLQTKTNSQSNSSTDGVLGFCFAMIFCGTLQEATAFLAHLLAHLAAQLFQLLTCLILMVWQLPGAQVLDLERFLSGYGLVASLLPFAHCLLALVLR